MTFKTYDYRYTAFDFNLANYSAGIYRLGGSEYIKNAPTGDASNIVYGNAVVLRGKNSDTVAMVVYPYYSKTPQAPYYKSSTVSGWTQASWARFALKDDLEYLEVVGDCNSAISTGKYVISNSGNAPCAYGFLDVKNAYTGRWLQQTATSTSGDIYVRHNTNSSGWTQWGLK